eukprot:766034-Hanusia_phi.AAC.7
MASYDEDFEDEEGEERQEEHEQRKMADHGSLEEERRARDYKNNNPDHFHPRGGGERGADGSMDVSLQHDLSVSSFEDQRPRNDAADLLKEPYWSQGLKQRKDSAMLIQRVFRGHVSRRVWGRVRETIGRDRRAYEEESNMKPWLLYFPATSKRDGGWLRSAARDHLIVPIGTLDPIQHFKSVGDIKVPPFFLSSRSSSAPFLPSSHVLVIRTGGCMFRSRGGACLTSPASLFFLASTRSPWTSSTTRTSDLAATPQLLSW